VTLEEDKPKKTKVSSGKRERRLGARITPELYQRLERIADFEQRSVSAQLQVALTEWVEAAEKRLGKDYRHSNPISPVAVNSTVAGVPALAAAI
jgi:hypothetical protein